MANTQPVRFSVSVVDELGTEASEVFYAMVDPTITAAQLSTQWHALATDLDPVLGAQILRGSVVLLENMSGGKTAPAVGSRVEQTGVINFSNAVTSHRFGEALPGLSSGVISAGKINLTDAGVAAFITFMTTAFTLGTWTNNAQQPLVALVDALLSFRKRRKQLARSSFER